MIELVRDIGLELVVVVGSGLVLLLGFRVANQMLSALPTTRGRATFERARPIVALGFALVWAVVALRWVLRDDAGASRYALVFVAGVGVVATWRVIRDVVEGALLRLANTVAVGDQIQIGDVRGRVQAVGIRAITIETAEGKLAILPHSQVAGSSVLRSPSADRSAFHVFRVPLPADAAIPAAKQRVREAALLSHWSSVAQPPQCVATADGELEITVFALDADRASEIERAVRLALAQPDDHQVPERTGPPVQRRG